MLWTQNNSVIKRFWCTMIHLCTIINLRNIANQKAILFTIDILLNEECKRTQNLLINSLELRTLIKDCGYPEGIHNEQITGDHTVFGVRSSKS